MKIHGLHRNRYWVKEGGNEDEIKVGIHSEGLASWNLNLRSDIVLSLF
jgi:hypothetical protein